MRERWAEICRQLVPEAMRECAFDPAAADLCHEWMSRSLPRGRLAAALAGLRYGIRLLVTALECRRLAVSSSWISPLQDNRENRMVIWLRDLARTIRQLIRQPLFTAAAVLTVALGTGANLTIFSFVNTLLLTPIPARDPASLVRVYGVAENTTTDVVSHPTYLDAQKGAPGLDLAAHSIAAARVGTGDAVEVRTVELISGTYFRVLGLAPASGRLIDERDDVTEGGHPVVVLAHGFWQSRFAGSQAAIGQALPINGVPFEIIGIAPEGYRGTFSAHAVDFWAPVMMHRAVQPSARKLTRRGWGFLSMIGRLKPGADLRSVGHDLDLVGDQIRQQFPTTVGSKFGLVVTPASAVNEADRRVMAPVLSTAFGFTILLMVVTCANLAGVMQARLSARRREMAIRHSLGAGRGRLASEWLTECLCLSIAGGVAGLVIARVTALAMARMQAPLVILGDLSFETLLDWRLMAYAVVLSLGCGLIYGLAPAWRAGRLQAFPLLKDEGATVAGGRQGTRLRRIAVLAQVTVSVVLLTAAGLLGAAIVRQQGLSPGFRTDDLGIASFNVSSEPGDVRTDLVQRLLERVRRHPAVVSADMTGRPPLSIGRDRMGIAIPGYVRPDGRRNMSIDYSVVGADFFKTLGFVFVAGATWSPHDQRPAVLVVNETFARRFWPDKNPVGQPVEILGRGTVAIAGVVRDTAHYEIGEAPLPFMYIPSVVEPPDSFELLVRTGQDPAAVMKDLRPQMAAVDPRLAPYDVMTFDELRRVPLFPGRLVMWTAVAFGLIALVLTGVGLYGVVSTSVAQRSREFGVRIALGARPADIERGVLREAGALVLLGATFGVLGAYFGAGVLESIVSGAGAFNPIISLPIAIGLAMLAILAAWVPAARAALVDPVLTLRG